MSFQRLYLPKDWTEDEERRRKAGVPEEVGFATRRRSRSGSFGRPVQPACRAALC